MANYLFSTVGLTDINLDSLIDEELKAELNSLINSKSPNLREGGKRLLELIKNQLIDFDSIRFQIFEPVLKYFDKKKIIIDEVFFIASDGPEENQGYNQDTVLYGELLRDYAEFKGFKSALIKVKGIASDFDDQFDNLPNELEKLPNAFDSQDDTAFVYIQSATPAMRNAILLNCINLFIHVKQLSQPRERGVVEEQHFPEKFRDEIRKKVYPHALKKAFAVILAKNMAHTDSSHLLPSFEKMYSKDSKAVLSLISYLKNTMEFTADSSEGYGNQSFINYKFDDIGKYLTRDLFSMYADDLKTEVESHFLGKGVVDGEGDAILEIDEKLNGQSVSLPGGETGKTALVVILKNFFRNLYKHSAKDSDKRFIAKLNLESESDELYKISLTEESQTYNLEKINESVENIKSFITDSILTPDLSVRDKGLGIAEMKIAAAYLIGLPLELFENSSQSNYGIFPSPFFDVSPLPINNELYKLKFSFHLLKTKIALVEKNDEWQESCHELPRGFDILDENDKNKGRKRHEFVIRKVKGEGIHKLKISNLKQVFLNYNENFENFLSEIEIQKNWIGNFSDVIPNAKGIVPIELSGRSEKPDVKKEDLCIFDHHARGIKTIYKSDLEVINSLFYYENYSSDAKPKDLIDQQGIKIDMEGRAKETILTNIALLDERIQENAQSTKDQDLRELNLQTLYSFKRIFIPEKLTYEDGEDIPFADWDINNFTGEKCSLKKLMYGEVNNETGCRFQFLVKLLEYYFAQKNCHYVVLHLSGFETIVNGSFEYLKSRINGYLYGDLDSAYWYLLGPNVLGKILKDKSKYLIFTSGKGATKTLPDNSYFVSLSNLEYTLKKNKYELVKLLNSVRKIKK